MQWRRCVELAVLAALLATAGAAPATAVAAPRRQIDFHSWSGPSAFGAGTAVGVGVDQAGALALTTPAGHGRWVSPAYAPGFGATQLIASWNATTPPGTWLQVEMLGRSDGRWQRHWLVLGRWASGDGDIHRTSVRGQAGRDGRVDVDTFIAPRSRPLDGYRLRVTLYRRQGSTATPSLSMLGAMTSALAPTRNVPAGGRPHRTRSIELPVPRYSQSIHRGEYPEYDNGGAAWCSPTSTQMVIEYWGRGPTSQDLAWVNPRFRDQQVDHAARMTYDFGYRGAGNWPFNTAYAAGYGLRAQVTRLRSLGELERFVARRIPVVTSVAFRRDELPGAGYGTNGHLMVVVGFTRKGDVIANDPAAPTNAAVRRVYPRRRFETVWLRTRRVGADGAVAAANGGIVYLIRPPEIALPPRTGRTANW